MVIGARQVVTWSTRRLVTHGGVVVPRRRYRHGPARAVLDVRCLDGHIGEEWFGRVGATHGPDPIECRVRDHLGVVQAWFRRGSGVVQAWFAAVVVGPPRSNNTAAPSWSSY